VMFTVTPVTLYDDVRPVQGGSAVMTDWVTLSVIGTEVEFW